VADGALPRWPDTTPPSPARHGEAARWRPTLPPAQRHGSKSGSQFKPHSHACPAGAVAWYPGRTERRHGGVPAPAQGHGTKTSTHISCTSEHGRRPKRSSAPRTASARSRGGLARRPGVAAARRPSSVHQTTCSSTRRPSHGDGDAQGHVRPKNANRRGTAMLRREGRHPGRGFTAMRLHTSTDTARTQGGEEKWMAVVLTVGRRCRRGRPDEDGSWMFRRCSCSRRRAPPSLDVAVRVPPPFLAPGSRLRLLPRPAHAAARAACLLPPNVAARQRAPAFSFSPSPPPNRGGGETPSGVVGLGLPSPTGLLSF
jgi:hypothetical protein